MNIIFLGTGTSHGVPSIDCMIENHARCKKGVCLEAARDPKHARTRSSILIEHAQRRILVDISADFRAQALRERIPAVDAVLITHNHADHIGGLPDIRSYTKAGKGLPVYCSPESAAYIRKSYSYIFDPDTFVGGGIPRVTLHEADQPFDLFGLRVTPLPVEHGNLLRCCGWRIGDVAYIPDMKSMPPSTRTLCGGLSCLILNCLRDEREHISHMILPQSVALARELKPRRCFFVHMCHDIHYIIDSRKIDPWMQFAWDGLRVIV